MLLQDSLSWKKKDTIFLLDALMQDIVSKSKQIFHVPSSSSIYLNGISIVTLYMWLINKSK